MRVVISQSVDLHPVRGERRDALDQAWGDALEALVGMPVSIMPLPNRPKAAARALQEWAPRLMVLSGGNDLGEAPERDATEAAMLVNARETGIPLLAVCRGMQMVQHFLGGTLDAVSGHVACEHSVKAVAGSGLPATLRVNSYHNWGIRAAALADGLEALYLNDDGTVEAARHVRLPWLSVMWHPERTRLGEPLANQWIAQWLREVL
jgi:putative glutamine amidotransferase